MSDVDQLKSRIRSVSEQLPHTEMATADSELDAARNELAAAWAGTRDPRPQVALGLYVASSDALQAAQAQMQRTARLLNTAAAAL